MSRYTVYVVPQAWGEIMELSGHIRQRVRNVIKELGDNPRPSQSKQLNVPQFSRELRRVRLDRWRILFVVTEADRTVDILAVRKRPPYDYGDLAKIIEEIQ